MAKVAFITDTHWGIRNDHIAFLDNQKRFLDDIFFPRLPEVDYVIHLGDLTDRRKNININTANRLRVDFLEKLQKAKPGVSFFVAGNHDTYFKNTNEINSLRELLVGYDFFVVDNVPYKFQTFDGDSILLIPWITPENREIVFDTIKRTDCQIGAGHLEIAGFEMYRGARVSHGDNRTLFDKFDMLFSGHFHHRSSDGHIFYLGSTGEYTWSDHDDPKGFHIFDTKTRELEFIKNPYTLHHKITYDESADQNIGPTVEGSFVKVIVKNKTDEFKFERFIEELVKQNPYQIQILEQHAITTGTEEEVTLETESSFDTIKRYINESEITVDKEILYNKFMEVYNEAMSIK